MTISTDNKADRCWAVGLMAILLVAAALRIGIVHYANTHSNRFMWPDSQRYMLVAGNIAAGQGPIVSPADRTGADPGYPLLLSWPARFWPGNIEKIAAIGRWMNVPAGLATVLFVAYLGRLLFGARAGLIGASILAAQPIQVYFHGLVLTEVLYTTLLIGSLYVLARYMMGGGGANLFLAGIGLGLAALTRSSGLFLPVPLLPIVAYAGWRRAGPIADEEKGTAPLGCCRWGLSPFPQTEDTGSDAQAGRVSPAPGRTVAPRGRFSSVIASLVVFCVCYACVLAPMAYRNYRIVGAMVPVRTGAGATLLEGNGPWADGGPGMEKVQWPEYPPGANEYVKDKINQHKAMEYIKNDPAGFLRLAGSKFLRTWNIRMNLSQYQSPLYDVLAILATVPVYVLLVVGWWRHRRQVSRWYVLIVPAVYFSLLHMVFVGSVRYRYPAMPALMVLAGAAFASAKRPGSSAPGPASTDAAPQVS